MSIRTQVEALKPLVSQLRSGDQHFAQSLVETWEKKGRLSQPQQLWVDKLIERAKERIAKMSEPKPETTQVELGSSMKPLHDLFMRAKENKIQFPKIRTQLDDGTKIELSLAGTNSVNAGKVYIKINGDWYGKVDDSGHMEISRRLQPRPEVHELVREIGLNPSKTGKVHGQKFDNCMFCGRGLTTKDSVFYGYGPICASKWGLEWGIARERIAEKKEANLTNAFANMVNQYFKDTK